MGHIVHLIAIGFCGLCLSLIGWTIGEYIVMIIKNKKDQWE